MQQTSKSIRLFLGASPGQQLLHEFSRHITLLKAHPWSHRTRWIDPDNIHMTLKFLGSTDVHRVDELIADLRKNLEFDPVTFQVGSIELFPSAKRPSVIAALVKQDGALNGLVRKLEHITCLHDFPNEQRVFRGHYTLARCADNFPRNLSLESLALDHCEQLTSVSLFRSETRSTGAVYTPLATFSCSATGQDVSR